MNPIGRVGRSSPTNSVRRLSLVGDDLFVTNTQILKRGIDEGRREFDSH